MRHTLPARTSLLTLGAFASLVMLPSVARGESPEIPRLLLAQNDPYPPYQPVPPPPPDPPLQPDPQPPSQGYPPPPPEYPPPVHLQPQLPAPPPGEPQPQPPGFRGYSSGPGAGWGYEPRWKLLIAGIATFTPVYLVTGSLGSGLVTGWLGSRNDASLLWVPVIGPLFYLTRDDPTLFFDFVLIVDAVAQAAGIGMMLAGLVGYRRPAFTVLPIATPSLGGLSVSGTF